MRVSWHSSVLCAWNIHCTVAYCLLVLINVISYATDLMAILITVSLLLALPAHIRYSRVSASRLYLAAFFPYHTYSHKLDSCSPSSNICVNYDPCLKEQSILCTPRINIVRYRYSWLLRAENATKNTGVTVNERWRRYGCKNLRNVN
jgi:hypothetical protein